MTRDAPATHRGPGAPARALALLTETLIQRSFAPERRDLTLAADLVVEAATEATDVIVTLVAALAAAVERVGELEGRDPLELVQELGLRRA